MRNAEFVFGTLLPAKKTPNVYQLFFNTCYVKVREGRQLDLLYPLRHQNDPKVECLRCDRRPAAWCRT
jgi:hypothetical protein